MIPVFLLHLFSRRRHLSCRCSVCLLHTFVLLFSMCDITVSLFLLHFIYLSWIKSLSISLSICSLSYKTFLSEDAGPDTLVAIVHANDPDGDAVSYAITGGNEDSNFLLDNQKGEEENMDVFNINMIDEGLTWYKQKHFLQGK